MADGGNPRVRDSGSEVQSPSPKWQLKTTDTEAAGDDLAGELDTKGTHRRHTCGRSCHKRCCRRKSAWVATPRTHVVWRLCTFSGAHSASL
jgi:hypothetical protein